MHYSFPTEPQLNLRIYTCVGDDHDWVQLPNLYIRRCQRCGHNETELDRHRMETAKDVVLYGGARGSGNSHVGNMGQLVAAAWESYVKDFPMDDVFDSYWDKTRIDVIDKKRRMALLESGRRKLAESMLVAHRLDPQKFLK